LKKLLIILLCSAPLAAGAADRTILVLADSLSAGYGLAVKDGWVSLLQDRLRDQGYNYRVVNASISGDTTRSAVARLNQVFSSVIPDIAIVELGGNDGLRGLAIDEIRRNLEDIVVRLTERNVRVLLLPMQLPPNYGAAYNSRFQQLYRDLSDRHGLVLGRFILEHIGDRAELMQEDGIHPKAEAQGMMLDNVWIDLEAMLNETRKDG